MNDKILGFCVLLALAFAMTQRPGELDQTPTYRANAGVRAKAEYKEEQERKFDLYNQCIAAQEDRARTGRMRRGDEYKWCYPGMGGYVKSGGRRRSHANMSDPIDAKEEAVFHAIVREACILANGWNSPYCSELRKGEIYKVF